MGLLSRIPCCQPKSYCYDTCHTTQKQKDNDPDWPWTKTAWISAGIFLLLAVVFASLLLRPEQTAAQGRKYLICFATFISLTPLPPIIRNCTCFAKLEPPPRKKSESSSDSDSSDSSSSDDGKL